MVFYPNPVRAGTDVVSSFGDGYSINVKWFQALRSVSSYQIAYHIYYATVKEAVFAEGPKLISIDGALEANIIDLTPGQEYFIAVRPVEYDPSFFDLTLLPISHDNLRYYPQSILRQDMSDASLIVPLVDVTDFPSTGVVRVGVELIRYIGVDTVNNDLIVPPPGPSVPASLVDLGGGNFFEPFGTNVGVGGLTNLSVGNGVTETWNITCVGVQRDSLGIPIASTAKFIAIGSITGIRRDPYGNPIIWTANGSIVSNGVLTFAITETSPVFREGDGFIVKIVGAEAGLDGGRGYDNTVARMHTVAGFDGVSFWDPAVPLFTIGENQMFDRIFMCQSRFEYPNYPFTIVDGYHQVLQDNLSTDLSESDEDNIDFPMYDFAGYHRTDPVQLLNGTCVGSYIGGEMGCIDGYGNYQILRGFSLQDQNTQRQDVLLSLTGRDAILVRRVHTGITCACYLASSEYQDDRCPMCFAAGTLINTDQGFKNIEDINIGDKVLSSDGAFHKVLNTFKTPFNGKLKSITTTTTIDPILATPDHTFFALGGSHKNHKGCGPNSNCKEFIKRGDGKYTTHGIKQLPSGKWHARTQIKGHSRKVLGTFDSKELAQQAINKYHKENYCPGHHIIGKESQDLTTKDWLVNKWNRFISDIQTIEIPPKFQKNTNLGQVRNGSIVFEVDEDFMWMIGLYLAEGSSGTRYIQFSLHKDEVVFQNKIVEYFKRYDYNTSITISGKGANVCVFSTSLANWFPQWLGELCDSKKIPIELMYLPDNKANALIQGIFDGDAGKRDLDLIQTSKILSLQVGEILMRLGKQPNLRTLKKNPILTPKGHERKITYGVSKELPAFTHNNRKGRWQLEENLLTKIKKIEDYQYDGYVYNLEVEDEHNYVVQNILVKNCYGTKFVFGYEQYFNPRISSGRIRVRVGPTPEGLKMYEAGLESEFPIDVWTLTVPTIKMRDVLILFDQTGVNEEFRYEVSEVIRNNTIVGLQGGQHFKAIRVRKTDPIYQIRVFRDSSMFPSKLNTSIGFVTGIPPHTHEIVISEQITSISQINQTTAVSQGHNHPIVDGQVMEVLGHTHTIII